MWKRVFESACALKKKGHSMKEREREIVSKGRERETCERECQ